MENVALLHVVCNDPIESHMLLSQQFIDQLRQLRILLLKARELQLSSLFELSKLFHFGGCLTRVQRFLLLVAYMRPVEVSQRFVSDFLTIIADAELVRPSAHLTSCHIKLLNELHVHLGDLPVDVDDAAGFIKVVMVLSKDTASRLLKTLV